VHFQDAGLYGRIAHLQPVQWENGWPVIGRTGEPVLRHAKPVASAVKACAPQTSDEFDVPALGLQWQWYANHRDDWYSLAARRGWLRLFPQIAQPALGLQPNLLLQKLPARSFTAETVLELFPSQPGEEAGVVIVGKSFTALGLLHEGTKNRIVLRTNDKLNVLSETVSNKVKLRVEIQNGGKCFLAFAEKDAFVSTLQAFQAEPGVWVGAKVGLYSVKGARHSVAGYADFDYFRFCESGACLH
jgi:beta-xylosidase